MKLWRCALPRWPEVPNFTACAALPASGCKNIVLRRQLGYVDQIALAGGLPGTWIIRHRHISPHPLSVTGQYVAYGQHDGLFAKLDGTANFRISSAGELHRLHGCSIMLRLRPVLCIGDHPSKGCPVFSSAWCACRWPAGSADRRRNRCGYDRSTPLWRQRETGGIEGVRVDSTSMKRLTALFLLGVFIR